MPYSQLLLTLLELGQRQKVGHRNSLLAQFPICGRAHLSSPLEQRRWQRRYHPCQGNGYICHHNSWRSTNTHAWRVRLACNHHYLHDGYHSSCCLSKSKTRNKSAKESLNEIDSFFQMWSPRSMTMTGHCAWPCCSFS